MGNQWVEAVTSMVDNLHGDDVTDVQKPYLTDAPYLVVLMKLKHDVNELGETSKVYYPSESVGIAAGIFIAALHNAGLAALTSTPLGADQKIRDLTGRPQHEKVFLLLPVGYPSKDCTVPYRVPYNKEEKLHVEKVLRKGLEEILTVV